MNHKIEGMSERGKYKIDGNYYYIYNDKVIDANGYHHPEEEEILLLGLRSPDKEYWEEKIELWDKEEAERIEKLGKPESWEVFKESQGKFKPEINPISFPDRYESYLSQWKSRKAPKKYFNALNAVK